MPSCTIHDPPLSDLHEEFASKNIIFRAVFPNIISTQETVLNFSNKYSFPFNCILDENQEMVNQFNASVYSEVFVHFSGNLVYKGMVNDSYSALGQWSPPENHYLYDVLSNLVQGRRLNILKIMQLGATFKNKKMELSKKIKKKKAYIEIYMCSFCFLVCSVVFSQGFFKHHQL